MYCEKYCPFNNVCKMEKQKCLILQRENEWKERYSYLIEQSNKTINALNKIIKDYEDEYLNVTEFRK